MNKNTNVNLHQLYAKKYDSARYSLLIMIVFTLVNSVLLIFGSDSYFLFSAQLPYYLLYLSKVLTGKMPTDFYEGEEITDFLPEGLYIGAIAFAAIACAVYFLCWFKSAKMNHKWLVAGLILFCVDTALSILLFGFSVDFIIDYVFAAYVIYSIASGISAQAKYRKLPEPAAEKPEGPDDFGFDERDFSPKEDSEKSEENQ